MALFVAHVQYRGFNIKMDQLRPLFYKHLMKVHFIWQQLWPWPCRLPARWSLCALLGALLEAKVYFISNHQRARNHKHLTKVHIKKVHFNINTSVVTIWTKRKGTWNTPDPTHLSTFKKSLIWVYSKGARCECIHKRPNLSAFKKGLIWVYLKRAWFKYFQMRHKLNTFKSDPFKRKAQLSRKPVGFEPTPPAMNAGALTLRYGFIGGSQFTS